MSVICICGICIPYAVLWPLILFAVKPVWDWLSKIFGFKPLNIEKGKKGATCCEGGVCKLPESNESAAEQRDSQDEPPVDHGKVIVLSSDEEFRQLTGKTSTTFVKFTAKWCKPCKEIDPFYKQLAADNETNIFLSVDVDEFDMIAGECQAIRIPLFAAFKNGKLTNSVVTSKEEDIAVFVKEMINA